MSSATQTVETQNALKQLGKNALWWTGLQLFLTFYMKAAESQGFMVCPLVSVFRLGTTRQMASNHFKVYQTKVEGLKKFIFTLNCPLALVYVDSDKLK